MPITSSGEKILRYQVPLSGYSTVVNSGNTFTHTLLSGEVYQLPNVINVNSDGSSVTTPAMVGFTASTCSPSKSISLSANTVLPGFNQLMTIVVTPSGITPTSYTLIYPINSTCSYTAITQTSSTFSFSAVGYSSKTLYVTATDNVDRVGSSLNYSVSSMTEVADFLTNAGITSTTQTSAVRTMCLSLWDTGLWNKIYCLYPFVGGTSTAHKYNIKDPRDLDAAYRMVFGGGWTHSSSGVTGNGSNTYADTKFSNTGASQNSLSFGVYNRTPGNSNWDMAASVTPRTQLVIATAGSSYWDINNGANSATIAIGTADILGLVTANRYDSNNTQISVDAVDIRTTQLTTSAPANTNFILGAFNTGASLPSARNYAICFIAQGLTPMEQSNLSSIINTYQTALGRNV